MKVRACMHNNETSSMTSSVVNEQNHHELDGLIPIHYDIGNLQKNVCGM